MIEYITVWSQNMKKFNRSLRITPHFLCLCGIFFE